MSSGNKKPRIKKEDVEVEEEKQVEENDRKTAPKVTLSEIFRAGQIKVGNVFSLRRKFKRSCKGYWVRKNAVVCTFFDHVTLLGRSD